MARRSIEATRAANRAYRKANRESINKQRRERYARDEELRLKERERIAKWRAENPDKVAAQDARRVDKSHGTSKRKTLTRKAKPRPVKPKPPPINESSSEYIARIRREFGLT